MPALTQKYLFSFLTLGLSLCLIIFPVAAFANSPPPPPTVWVDFLDWVEPIDAVQVVTCESPACSQPQVVGQFGQCSIAGCTIQASRPDSEASSIRLDCHEKSCLLTEATIQEETLLQLRVRSSDRIRTTPVFGVAGTSDPAWFVSEAGESLEIELGNAWDRKTKPSLYWGVGFLLTIATEFLVLSLVLRSMKMDRITWLRTYMSFGLVHLVTYPLVWTLPIGLLPLELRIERVLGVGALVIALLYFGFLYYLRRAKAWRLILGSLFLLGCLHFLNVLIALAITYGQWERTSLGMNFWLAIAIVEIFITVYEAGVLHILSRRGRLSLGQTGVMSILMNGASLAIGLLFWQTQG